MTDIERQAEAHGQHVKEKAAREMRPTPIQAWPTDPDGNPMPIVTGAASDLVPTVQFGNVCVGPVTIQRPIPAHSSLQEIIDLARETQRAAEYVVGAERRLLQWALDPASKIQSPYTGDDAFAKPPADYDPTLLQHPGEVPPPQAPPAPPAAAPDPAPPAGDVTPPAA